MTLPYPIRSDVMMHLHEELVKVPMFQQAEGSFLRALVVRLGNQVICRATTSFGRATPARKCSSSARGRWTW